MNRWLFTILIILASMIAGFLVYKQFGSEKAGYIVALAGTAAGLAGLYVSLSSKGRQLFKSRVKVGRAKDSNITGVDYSGHSSNHETHANVEVKDIKRGDVTGVKWKERKH